MSHLSATDAALVEAVYEQFPPPRLRNCPFLPTPTQEAYLLLNDVFEVFFGGAAGGGKTAALLIAALQYTDVPGYDALLVRPTLAELQLPGGLIDLSHDWLTGTRARWNNELKQWRFPGRGRSGAGGASLGFGYLSDTNDLARYAGSSYSYLGFDELTRFSEQLYRRMLRVLRQPTAVANHAAAADGTSLNGVPIRVRSASNPGGPGHTWVKHRFVDPLTRNPDVLFLPSRLADNPHLDQERYATTLNELPTAERERLLHGDWQIPDDGELFRRDWFPIIEPHQVPDRTHTVRAWDFAGSEPSPANNDPDYTVGLRLEIDPTSGNFYISDLIRVRKAPGAIEQLVAATAARDGHQTTILIEQEPGSSGKAVTDRYKRHVLRGYTVHSRRATGPKDVRARPAAAAAENGLIHIVRGRHTTDLLDELSAFPHAQHDDCIDALAAAHHHLSHNPKRDGSISVPQGRIPGVAHTHSAHRSRYGDDPIEDIAARIGARVYPSRP